MFKFMKCLGVSFEKISYFLNWLLNIIYSEGVVIMDQGRLNIMQKG